ncbi:MAG: diaminopimelate decarboxylase [Desulfobacter postgatei]|uniref:diaminopimelate decarboxylase n=1 Tax=Desulfobacter postgatei TaxID=2293 RepID=UPI0023F4476E|nr:diaminopimelate decarboxylase [Desulfobacter postgatei]MDD4274045.1 diaminopimelate decarboxylase [Desulfobacter postgatei]
MPMSPEFKERLSTVVQDAVSAFGTPFHIYDETGIIQTCQALNEAFAPIDGFKEYFAVKGLPNPTVMALLKTQGFGFDCSSVPEIELARKVGSNAEDIMFTSNNTTRRQLKAAMDQGGSIINLDDITLIAKLPAIPDLLCFRYNPGATRQGNAIIGKPEEAKYGLTREQIFSAYGQALELGVKRFGLHTMIASNERNYRYMIDTAEMLLELAEEVSRALDIRFEFINIGGGLGIPYEPDHKAFNLEGMAVGIIEAFENFKAKNGWIPKLYMESARYITGPHGVLVTSVINHKNTYRSYVGVDASMSALMRPGMYGAYHHIHIHGKSESAPLKTVDVVGALCENNDKFSIQRQLPETREGDILIIHDTGAHGHAMGFNYNGQLRPKELLLKTDGSIELIRRAETMDDYFATLNFEPQIITPGRS